MRSPLLVLALLVGATPGVAIEPATVQELVVRPATVVLHGRDEARQLIVTAVLPGNKLHDLTGGWTVPLLVLTALTVPLLLVGLAVARPAYVEDQLRG